ncbi:MAG: substrate-binding domain-containing protein [Spirochaetaceae bacterium]|jgi:ribose transport system substrate-binding protein|nr:substrate-binding domain-containing protein [Spirochaetaceae bacterium]
MKKFLIVFAALLVSATMLFTGCQKKEAAQADASASGTSAAAKTLRFGFILTGQNFFWDTVAEGAREGAKQLKTEKGVDIEIIANSPPNMALNEQIQIFEDMVSQGVDAICIAPLDPNAIRPLVDNAVAKGVPVVLIDADIPDSKRYCFVGSDHYSVGVTMAKEAIKLLGGKGTVIIEQGQMTQTAMVDRNRGIHETLDKEAGIKIAAERTYGTNFAQAAADLEDMSTLNPDFGCLIYMDAGGENAVNLFGQKNWTSKDHFAVLSDDLETIIRAVASGVISSTVVQGQFNWGVEGCKQMLNAVQGIPAAQDIVHTPNHVVDKSNVAAEYPQWAN